MKTLPFFLPSMSLHTSPTLPAAAPTSPLSSLLWSVHYALNFPTGAPILARLEYSALTSAAALRAFTYELNRAREVQPFRCSVLVLAVEPVGAVND